MADELEQYLASLERDQGYRVERVLKAGDSETTEVVVADEGPYSGKPLIRKRFKAESGLGSAYTRIWEAQQQGATFLHVPRIVDFYSTCRELVVVSEYASGETLTDVIYRLDPSIELAVDVFPRLCDAVAELHECFDSPLIHRDLKPSNIVLSYGALKLIDFGIARSYTEGADSDTHQFGTRAYAPPEQFGYGQTDERSDIYALGMILYYCLTERTPDAQAREASWHDGRIPEPLRAVIEQAASFDPAERYGSAAELKQAFLDAVDAVRRPSTTGIGPKSLARSVGSFIRNVPAPLGLAWDVLLLFFLGVLLIASVNSAFNPRPGAPEENTPTALLLVSYLVLFFTIIVPPAFIVCDRRPLYRVFKGMKDVSLARQIGAAVVTMLFGFLAVGMCTTVMGAI